MMIGMRNISLSVSRCLLVGFPEGWRSRIRARHRATVPIFSSLIGGWVAVMCSQQRPAATHTTYHNCLEVDWYDGCSVWVTMAS